MDTTITSETPTCYDWGPRLMDYDQLEAKVVEHVETHLKSLHHIALALSILEALETLTLVCNELDVHDWHTRIHSIVIPQIDVNECFDL